MNAYLGSNQYTEPPQDYPHPGLSIDARGEAPACKLKCTQSLASNGTTL